MRRWIAGFAAAVVSLFAAVACQSSGDPRGPGAIAITTVTRLLEPKTFQYGVHVDGGTPRLFFSFDSTVFQLNGLAHGAHTVGTTNAPSYCTGGEAQTVTLQGDDTARVKIALQCARTTGDLNVTVVTTGTDLDPNGYFILTNNVVRSSVATNGTRLMLYITPGLYTVTLGNVEPNCTASSPPAVTINAGATASVSFTVTCAAVGYAKFVATTTGADRDPDGPTLAFDAAAPVQISPNATTVTRLTAGSHSYAIADVQPNCTLGGAATGTITVPLGDTVAITAASTCTAIPAGTAGFSSTDPAGDTLSNPSAGPRAHDITIMSGRYTSGWIILVMRFAKPVTSSANGAPEGVYGEVDLDTDENTATGVPPLMNSYGGAAAQGADYAIGLFNMDSVSAPIAKTSTATYTVVGRVRVRVEADSITIYVPLAKLGGDDGNMTVTTIVGTLDRPTDYAPNTGVVTAHSSVVAASRLAPERLPTATVRQPTGRKWTELSHPPSARKH